MEDIQPQGREGVMSSSFSGLDEADDCILEHFHIERI